MPILKKETKIIYPKKIFGELTLKGGLNNLTQTLKAKYLYPTRNFPEGKAVIEIIIPDHVNSFAIDKNLMKNVPELIENLSFILEKLESSKDKEIMAEQINFNKTLFDLAQNQKKSFTVKSFRFTDRDYVSAQHLMSHLGKLFGYSYYKYKNDIEKEGRTHYLASSMNAIANGMSKKVYDNFIAGFMEGVNEIEHKEVKNNE